MTAIKRCCALALAVLMILTALPVTAFAETAAHETNASLHETTVGWYRQRYHPPGPAQQPEGRRKNPDGKHRQARRQR